MPPRRNRIQRLGVIVLAATLMGLAVLHSRNSGGLMDPWLAVLPLLVLVMALRADGGTGRVWSLAAAAGLFIVPFLSSGADQLSSPASIQQLVAHLCLVLGVGFGVDLHQRNRRGLRDRADRAQRRLAEVVEENRREQLQRRESDDLFEVLFEISPIAMVVHSNGILRHCNPAAVRLLGAASDVEILGRPATEFLHPDDHEALKARVAEAFESGRSTPPHASRLLRLDGSQVRIEAVDTPVSFGGEPSVQTFLRDVEAELCDEENLRRSAAELASTNEELRRTRDAALEATRLKSQFLANISHEIRTPMNAMLGMTQLLQETELSDEQLEYIEILHQAGLGLMEMMKDMLDLARVETGELYLEEVEFDPRVVLAEVEQRLGGLAREKGLDFAASIDDDVPILHRGDPQRLRQILIALGTNAVKFTDSGSVRLHVQPAVSNPSEGLLFEVIDTGAGIDEEDRSRLFESFIQADGSSTRRAGGAGLGLSITRHLVERMGGQIGLESRLGEGSRFWVLLPRAAEAATSSPETGNRDPVHA